MPGPILDPLPDLPDVRTRGLDAVPATLGAAIGAAAEDAWVRNPAPSLFRWLGRQRHYPTSPDAKNEFGLPLGPLPGGAAAVETAAAMNDPARQRSAAAPAAAMLPRDQANERFGIDGHLKFENDVPEPVAAELHALKRDELRRQDIMARGPGGAGQVLGSLAAGLGVSLLDPLNIASAFVPVVGPTRYALWMERFGAAGGRALAGAVEGGVGAALLEPFVYGVAKSEQADYDAVDSLLNLTFGTALGGGLHVGLGALRDRFGVKSDPRAARAADEAGLRVALADLAEKGRVENAALAAKLDDVQAAVGSGIPARSSSAGSTVEPLAKASNAADGSSIQEFFSAAQRTIWAPPSDNGFSANKNPSLERTPDRFSGSTETSSLGDTHDIGTVLDRASAAKPALDDFLAAAVEGVPGAHFHVSRVKDRRVAEAKLTARGLRAGQLGDALGGRIVVDDWKALGDILTRLKAGARILEIDDKLVKPNPTGYRAIHVQIAGPNGAQAEIQIQPREIRETQAKVHEGYAAWRRRDAATLSPADVAQRDEAMTRERKAFADAWDKWSRRVGPRPIPGQPSGEIRRLDPAHVGVDATRMQFKAGGDASGVTDRLAGVKTWDERLAGVALAWEDDAARLWIVDGHQRLGLAKRLAAEGQHPALNAMVFRASDGVTAEAAMVVAGLKNIAEGSGTALDAAKVLRLIAAHPEIAHVAGGLPPLPPRSPLVRDAQALARLGPEAWGMAVNEVVPASHAAVVGRSVADPKEQAGAIAVLAQAKPANVNQAELMVREIVAAGFAREEQLGLFGKSDEAISLMADRARLLDAALKRLRRDSRVFAALLDEEGRIADAGNTLDRAANEARLSDDKLLLLALTRLGTRAGPVGDALGRRVMELRAGERIGQAANRLIDDVQDAIAKGALTGEDVRVETASVAPAERPSHQLRSAGDPEAHAAAPVPGERDIAAADLFDDEIPRASRAAETARSAPAVETPGAKNDAETALADAEARLDRLKAEGLIGEREPELAAADAAAKAADAEAKAYDAGAACMGRRGAP